MDFRSVDDGPDAADAELSGALVLPAAAEHYEKFDAEDLLRRAGLRPTRQRLQLVTLLFGQGGRHLTADRLHAEAAAADSEMSLATVYNALHQFTEAGLLRQIGINGAKSYFDTNPTTHPHFFIRGEDRLLDIPHGVELKKLPAIPAGYDIARIDVVVHLRRKQG